MASQPAAAAEAGAPSEAGLSEAWEQAMAGSVGDVWTEPRLFTRLVTEMNAGPGDEAVGPLRFERLSRSAEGPLLLYVPGVDFTGTFAAAQFRGLAGAGYDLWRCFCGPDDRTPFVVLLKSLEQFARKRIAEGREVVILGESFGGLLSLALALRLGKELSGLALVNPATSFGRTPWSLLSRLLTAIPAADAPLPPVAAQSNEEFLLEMQSRAAQTPYAYLGTFALSQSVADASQLGRVASKIATSIMAAPDGAGVNELLRDFMTYPEQVAAMLPPDTVSFRVRAWLRDGCEAVIIVLIIVMISSISIRTT